MATDVLWLHKSKEGKHLYTFANEGNFHNVKSLLVNISEVQALIDGNVKYIKVSLMKEEEEEEEGPGGLI